MTRLNWERVRVVDQEREAARLPVVNRADQPWYCVKCRRRLRKSLGASMVCRDCRDGVWLAL